MSVNGDVASRRVVVRIRRAVRSISRWRATSTDLDTALVVLVPIAEERIVDLRWNLDANAMPAHITVLFPFVRTSLLTGDVISLLRNTFQGIEPFTFELSEVGWFEDRVLYLVPTPTVPFRELTELVSNIFPDQKPYGGEFTEIVPHLTVAEGASRSKLRDAARVVSERLPIAAEVTVINLMVQDVSGRWTVHSEFHLGR